MNPMERVIEVVKVKRKSVKTVVSELKRKGFHSFDWSEDEMELEAVETFGGLVNRKAYVKFSENGRAVTDLTITAFGW